MFVASVPTGRVADRYEVKEQEFKVYAVSRREAIRAATYRVADGVGLPPWKPWLRELARMIVLRRGEDEEWPA